MAAIPFPGCMESSSDSKQAENHLMSFPLCDPQMGKETSTGK